MGEPRWTFLSNHAHVLLCVAHTSNTTIRALSDEVGITERAVQRILKDLEVAGYVRKHRQGRRNDYVVDPRRPLRHPLDAHHTIGALIAVLGPRALPRSNVSPRSKSRLPAKRTGRALRTARIVR